MEDGSGTGRAEYAHGMLALANRLSRQGRVFDAEKIYRFLVRCAPPELLDTLQSNLQLLRFQGPHPSNDQKTALTVNWLIAHQSAVSDGWREQLLSSEGAEHLHGSAEASDVAIFDSLERYRTRSYGGRVQVLHVRDFPALKASHGGSSAEMLQELTEFSALVCGDEVTQRELDKLHANVCRIPSLFPSSRGVSAHGTSDSESTGGYSQRLETSSRSDSTFPEGLAEYEALLLRALDYADAEIKVCFVPLLRPHREFATGRIRCEYPAQAINMRPSGSMRARVGYDSAADIVVVSQMCKPEALKAMVANPRQLVLYDVCDPHWRVIDPEDRGQLGARERFFQIAKRADRITASTTELVSMIEGLGLEVPVSHLPDGLDYGNHGQQRTPRQIHDEEPLVIGWFGNPGRGNLESSAWMLRHLRDRGHEIRLITDLSRLESHEDLKVAATQWQFQTFPQELSDCDVVLMSHSADQQNKSPNRLLTAVDIGVPVIVASSVAYEDLLRPVGLDWAIVSSTEELDEALNRLRNEAHQVDYLGRLSTTIGRYSPMQMLDRYLVEFGHLLEGGIDHHPDLQLSS